VGKWGERTKYRNEETEVTQHAVFRRLDSLADFRQTPLRGSSSTTPGPVRGSVGGAPCHPREEDPVEGADDQEAGGGHHDDVEPREAPGLESDADTDEQQHRLEPAEGHDGPRGQRQLAAVVLHLLVDGVGRAADEEDDRVDRHPGDEADVGAVVDVRLVVRGRPRQVEDAEEQHDQPEGGGEARALQGELDPGRGVLDDGTDGHEDHSKRVGVSRGGCG
jgi:hypothetical protein